MKSLRSLTALLGRSRLLLLAALVLAVFLGMGFLDLVVNQRMARAQYVQELERVKRLESQNVLLQQELDRAQQNEHVPWLAWDYFGRAPKGVGVIESVPMVQPAVQVETEPRATLWTTLLRGLGLN